MSEEKVATLVERARWDEAVELALDHPTRQIADQLVGLRELESLPRFLDRWLPELPPLERLQAAAPLAEREQLLGCHAAAAAAFAAELRGFWSFTDGPDAEVAPAIMDRFGRYADQVDAMSFQTGSVPAGPVDAPPAEPAPVSPFDDDPPPFDPLPVLPAAQNELMSLIAGGRQDEALQLALRHRESWVQIRLDYDAVDINDDASSAFLQAWLPSLPPLERLQATSWASSNFQLALVHLPHAYGIGAGLLLEALASAATCWACLLREFGGAGTTSEDPDGSVIRRLRAYADQLEALSFEPIFLDPED